MTEKELNDLAAGVEKERGVGNLRAACRILVREVRRLRREVEELSNPRGCVECGGNPDGCCRECGRVG